MKKFYVGLAILAFNLCLLEELVAQQASWVNTTGFNNEFNEPSNWSTNLVPDINQDALFNQASAYEVFFTQNEASRIVSATQGLVSFFGSGNDYQVGDDFFLGGADLEVIDVHIDVNDRFQTFNGSNLNLLSGSITGETVTIGSGGSSSMALVDGGASLNADGILSVGFVASSILSIENGGQVNSQRGDLGVNPGVSGMVSITGAGSTWTTTRGVIVGFQGLGTLNIADGGRLETGDGQFSSILGASPNSQGTVDITNGSWVQDGNIVVGQSASNLSSSISLSDGSTLESTIVFIGSPAGSDGLVSVNGSTWSNLEEIYVGSSGAGRLEISLGGMVTNRNAQIGRFAGSEGTVFVQDSTWHHDGLSVGFEGNGTLTAFNSVIDTANSVLIGQWDDAMGIATVDNTVWDLGGVTIGNSGSAIGSLTVSNGSMVTASTSTRIGFQAGTLGDLCVTGPGTSFSSPGILVGISGDATLRVEDGGVLQTSSTAEIAAGNASESVVTVDGAGARWDHLDNLGIGTNGIGSLSINNGGVLTTNGNFTYIAQRNGSTGNVLVDGTDSCWKHTGDLQLGSPGEGGEAELTVSNGGVVAVSGDLLLSQGAMFANVEINGGTMTVNDVDFDTLGSFHTIELNDGNFNANVVDALRGSLTINGGVWRCATIQGTDVGIFDFNGGVLSVDHFVGEFEHSGGTLTPGDPIGITSVMADDFTGRYRLLAGAAAEFEIGGSIRGVDYDAMNVQGSSTFDGTVRVVLVGNFQPAVGDSFDLVDAPLIGSATGGPTFDFSEAQLPVSRQWDTSDFMNSGTISVVAGLVLGDVNQDGLVNLLDIGPFVDRVSNGVFQAEADVNQDGLVNLLDIGPFIDLLSN